MEMKRGPNLDKISSEPTTTLTPPSFAAAFLPSEDKTEIVQKWARSKLF
jgi:hypothetical protein